MKILTARFNLRLAANVVEKNARVAQAVRSDDVADDAHRYRADQLQQLSEACLMGAVYDYLLAIADLPESREARKL